MIKTKREFLKSSKNIINPCNKHGQPTIIPFGFGWAIFCEECKIVTAKEKQVAITKWNSENSDYLKFEKTI